MPNQFHRMPACGSFYFHMSVLLQRCDGGPADIIELGLHDVKTTPTVGIKKVQDSLASSPAKMMVDSRYMWKYNLHRGQLKFNKTIFIAMNKICNKYAKISASSILKICL